MTAALILSLVVGSPPEPDSRLLTLKVGRLTRTAVVFAPAEKSRSGSPVVIAFHGHSGSGSDFATKTNLAALWPEAYVIFPDGLKTPSPGDPAGEDAGWQHDVGDQDDRDLRLFDALVKQFTHSARKGRAQRVYVVGFSNGARFGYLLWSVRSRDIAAVAVAAGTCMSNDTCQSLPPRPAMLIYGTGDPRCKYPSAVKTIDAVLHANKSKLGLSEREPDPALHVEEAEHGFTGWALRPNAGLFRGGVGGADTLVIVHPEGHSWQKDRSPDVVRFFKEH